MTAFSHRVLIPPGIIGFALVHGSHLSNANSVHSPEDTGLVSFREIENISLLVCIFLKMLMM